MNLKPMKFAWKALLVTLVLLLKLAKPSQLHRQPIRAGRQREKLVFSRIVRCHFSLQRLTRIRQRHVGIGNRCAGLIGYHSAQ